jgi:hypothetical protein
VGDKYAAVAKDGGAHGKDGANYAIAHGRRHS